MAASFFTFYPQKSLKSKNFQKTFYAFNREKEIKSEQFFRKSNFSKSARGF
jgi:hypothetical protein